ncbi:MAG: amidohydrolase family protein [Chloroflexi bacterium]|nr:amidohydrolase family protein [Chloroflexota bacterium]
MTTQEPEPLQLSFPIVDIHTHLMPERLFAAVRAHFRANLWHPRYDAPTEELVQALLAAGASRFVFMPYAHRGEMARSLNHWVANVQQTFAPNGIGFGTFHPDDAELLPSLVDEAFGALGLRGAKLHPQVGRFAVDDPRLDPLYAYAEERGTVLLIHAGRRPDVSEFVGARVFGRMMRRFPRLKVIVAHAGADEFDAFFDLCGIYEDVFLDTAMVFNKYLGGPPPIQRVLEFQDRVLFGSDFPNIPYRWETAVQSILDLRLGRALEEKLLCTNAARLLGLDPRELTAPADSEPPPSPGP